MIPAPGRRFAAALALVTGAWLGVSARALAIGSELLYQDPFDLGAGGASLTRATKEGLVVANPALLGVGGPKLRWLGLSQTTIAGTQSVSEAQSLLQSSKSGGGAVGGSDVSGFLNELARSPLHVGTGIAAGYVTSATALTLFAHAEIDAHLHTIGAEGLPQVELAAQAYAGGYFGFQIPTSLRWLSLGVAVKEVAANEISFAPTLTDTQAIQDFQSNGLKNSLTGVNKGAGGDVGSVVFLQGSSVDWMLAATVDDVGNTRLSGPATSPTELKQTANAGTALTFHTGADAIHLAFDYRDVTDVYHELPFKRAHAGAKLLLRNHFGFGAGYYDGYPSVGAELDLWVLRVAAARYTEELGDHPGADPRPIYLLSLCAGF